MAGVISVCWVLLSLTAPQACKVSVWKTTLRSLYRGVEQFEAAYGRLPTEEEGLRVMVEKPANWSAGREWVWFLEAVPVDTWAHEIRYVLQPDPDHRFGFYSLGQDGVTFSAGNDADDINTWSQQRSWDRCFQRHGWREGVVWRLFAGTVFGGALLLLLCIFSSLCSTRRAESGQR